MSAPVLLRLLLPRPRRAVQDALRQEALRHEELLAYLREPVVTRLPVGRPSGLAARLHTRPPSGALVGSGPQWGPGT